MRQTTWSLARRPASALRFNCPYPTATLRYVVERAGNRAAGDPDGVRRSPYEFDLPLLKDAGLLAKSLNLNGAAATRLHEQGLNFAQHERPEVQCPTWKLGLDWHLLDDQMTIRGHPFARHPRAEPDRDVQLRA